jgi:hypothetical protein
VSPKDCRKLSHPADANEINENSERKECSIAGIAIFIDKHLTFQL